MPYRMLRAILFLLLQLLIVIGEDLLSDGVPSDDMHNCPARNLQLRSPAKRNNTTTHQPTTLVMNIKSFI
jgi:hypothetical protein